MEDSSSSSSTATYTTRSSCGITIRPQQIVVVAIVDDNLGFAALTGAKPCKLSLRSCIVEPDVGSSGETRGTGWAAVDFCCEDGVHEGVGKFGVAGLDGEPAGGWGCGGGG